MQWFFHLSPNSLLELTDGISNDLQKQPRYFNDTVNFVIFNFKLAPSEPLPVPAIVFAFPSFLILKLYTREN